MLTSAGSARIRRGMRGVHSAESLHAFPATRVGRILPFRAGDGLHAPADRRKKQIHQACRGDAAKEPGGPARTHLSPLQPPYAAARLSVASNVTALPPRSGAQSRYGTAISNRLAQTLEQAFRLRLPLFRRLGPTPSPVDKPVSLVHARAEPVHEPGHAAKQQRRHGDGYSGREPSERFHWHGSLYAPDSVGRQAGREGNRSAGATMSGSSKPYGLSGRAFGQTDSYAAI